MNINNDDQKIIKKEENDKFIVNDCQSMSYDIENKKVTNSNQPKKLAHSTNINNLILSCVRNEEYCFTIMDYFKKMMHFSQIDYLSAYTQLLYCFKPKEL